MRWASLRYTSLQYTVFTANCCYKLQLYSTLDIVYRNLLLQVTDQSVTYHTCSISQSYCTVAQPITVYRYKKNTLQHHMAFIALLLMELNYVLWCRVTNQLSDTLHYRTAANGINNGYCS